MSLKKVLKKRNRGCYFFFLGDGGSAYMALNNGSHNNLQKFLLNQFVYRNGD